MAIEAMDHISTMTTSSMTVASSIVNTSVATGSAAAAAVALKSNKIHAINNNNNKNNNNNNKSAAVEPAQKAKMDDAVQKLQSNLVRYTKAQDRRMVLRSLRDVKFLSCLILDPMQITEDFDLVELEKEVCEEKVILNGIPFRPVGRNAVGKSRGSNCTIHMLKGVCSQLCERPEVNYDSDELYKQLVLRLAGTTASADPYFRLNSLLGSSDLLVMPLTVENQQAAAIASGAKALNHHKPAPKDTPPARQAIQLNVYESHGDLHVSHSQTYKFGLFRKGDVKAGRAWIGIDAVVSERANMTTGSSVRRMTVKLPDLY